MIHRGRVLSLYTRLLRLSRTWEATEAEDTPAERNYIKQETKSLFRKNQHLSNDAEILQHLQEAEARIDLGVHYRTPYPRPMNYPQTVLPPTAGRRKMKQQEQILKESKSIYLKSLYDNKR